MSKTLLKKKIKERQNGQSALGAVQLPDDHELWDTDRIEPKKDGGNYTDKNTRGVNPVEHMKRHNSYKERESELHDLKIMIDGREQVRKLVNSCNNRLLAMRRRTDDLDTITETWLLNQAIEVKKELGSIDKRIVKQLKTMGHPIIKSALGVKGVVPTTGAYMLCDIEIETTGYVSAMWSYVGMVKPSYKRYEKGVTGGGNKTLRTVLYTMADSMIKTRSIYRDVYDLEKLKLSQSHKLVISRNTQGKEIECMWKDTKPSHRHGAGIRKIIKHFLADWWKVERTLAGLDTPKFYVEEHLGHTDMISPDERGWKY